MQTAGYEHLRLAAFWVYVGAWVVFGVLAFIGALPRRSRRATAPVQITMPVIVGILLQGISALPITLSLREGPLRPQIFELLGTLMLAPFGASLFAWVLASSKGVHAGPSLVTWGPYAWLRHPMYLAFFAMLVATGLLASAGFALAAAVGLFVAGSELRIASEEAGMDRMFPGQYADYRLRTRWRYLPGIR